MKKITDRNRCKKILKIEPMQYFIIIMAILGLAVILTLIFAVVWFSGERIGVFPYLGVYDINGLTEGENWLVFVSSFIFTTFIGLLVLWLIYRWYRKEQCSDFDDAVEMPIEV